MLYFFVSGSIKPMRDYRSVGEQILNGIFVAFWLISRPFKWVGVGLYNLAVAVWKNFYMRLVVFLGGLAFAYFLYTVSDFFK